MRYTLRTQGPSRPWRRLHVQGLLRLTALIAVLCLAGGVQSYSDTPMPVNINLWNFYLADADEDGTFSDGDEPYLFVVAIYADGTSIKLDDFGNAHVRLQSPTRTHGNIIGGHVTAGTSVAIPADVGQFHNTILPITLPSGNLADAKKTARVGLLVIAMEEDLTPADVVAAGRQALLDNLQTELDHAVRTLSTPDIDQLSKTISDKVRSAMEAQSLNSLTGILAGVDPDDYIGAQFALWSYADIENAGSNGIPVDMRFEKPGVSYEVSGKVSAELPAQMFATVNFVSAKVVDNRTTTPTPAALKLSLIPGPASTQFPATDQYAFPRDQAAELGGTKLSCGFRTDQSVGVVVSTDLPVELHFNPKTHQLLPVEERNLQIIRSYGKAQNWGVGTHTDQIEGHDGLLEITYSIATRRALKILDGTLAPVRGNVMEATPTPQPSGGGGVVLPRRGTIFRRQ
jgi:hypothetical protein